jgi:hypothetical protein
MKDLTAPYRRSWRDRIDKFLCVSWLWLVFPVGLFLIVVLRERTYVAWAYGPVMLGWGMAHSLLGLALTVAYVLMALWTAAGVLIVTIDLIRRRRPSSAVARRLALNMIGSLVLVLPFGTWESVPVLLLGPGRGGNELMVEAGDNHSRYLMDVLRRKGVDINARSESGWTALMEAADNAGPSLVQWMLEHGANPNAVDNLSGTTPLLQAIQKNELRVIQILLARGADPRYRDFTGKTGVDHAIARGDSLIIGAVKAAANDRGSS